MRAHPAGPRHGDLVNEHAPTVAPADLNALSAKVWPLGAARDKQGRVGLHGKALTELADEFGSPLFVLDEEDFRSRARGYAQGFEGADVYYASKAFTSTRLLRWVADEGLCVDVATAGELAVALNAQFPPERILFHGNNKSEEELQHCRRGRRRKNRHRL